jgi:hypothetical protein
VDLAKRLIAAAERPIVSIGLSVPQLVDKVSTSATPGAA